MYVFLKPTSACLTRNALVIRWLLLRSIKSISKSLDDVLLSYRTEKPPDVVTSLLRYFAAGHKGSGLACVHRCYL